MKLEEIDKSTLKVGDTVGFQTENYFYNFVFQVSNNASK